MEHASDLNPTSEVGAVWSRRLRVSDEPLRSGEAGSGAEGHVAALDPLDSEAVSGGSGYVAAPESS
jgi:hypothetical protein